MNKVGEVVVKGLAYEDVVSILGNNGYATEVYTTPFGGRSVMDVEHRIRIYEHNFKNSEEDK